MKYALLSLLILSGCGKYDNTTAGDKAIIFGTLGVMAFGAYQLAK